MQLNEGVSGCAYTLLHTPRRRQMPFDSMLAAAAVIMMFLCFALPVAWAVQQTSGKA